jgi:hypothetical protein
MILILVLVCDMSQPFDPFHSAAARNSPLASDMFQPKKEVNVVLQGGRFSF